MSDGKLLRKKGSLIGKDMQGAGVETTFDRVSDGLVNSFIYNYVYTCKNSVGD